LGNWAQTETGSGAESPLRGIAGSGLDDLGRRRREVLLHGHLLVLLFLLGGYLILLAAIQEKNAD
jgi:uncharacterized membrane protein